MSAPQVNLSFPNGSKSSFSGGLFINGEFVPAKDGKTFSVVNPATGKEIAQVSEASPKDVDAAVIAARKAYNESWGLKVNGGQRGRLLNKLADLIEEHADEIAAIESLDNGKPVSIARNVDIAGVIDCIRYYAGWADKNHGKVIETDESVFNYTREEPIGVCGQIIPWNFPALMLAWKWGPALACGNVIVMKTAEQTPLSALKFAELSVKAGFPPGVINVLSGFGPTAGAAVANHMDIDKIAFTGSTLVGRNILKASASTNLKKTTLELGGKSPNIILKEADLEQAVSWCLFGFTFNTGQTCCAGTRVFVEDEIYDTFVEKLVAKAKSIKVGDGFQQDTFLGPQVSQTQFDRVMAYIEAGKQGGATLLTGGSRQGNEGYFIPPTIFTDVDHDAKINREEIFGPVVVVHRFKSQEELLKRAGDTTYGLAAAVFTQNITRGIQTAHALQAGTVWLNCYNRLDSRVPFGGYKQSGIGRELGEYALANYTQVKAVHVNLAMPAPL